MAIQIGDRLAAIIASDRLAGLLTKTSNPGCASCLSMKEQMNRWGVKGCEKYRQLIVDHLSREATSRFPLICRLFPGSVQRQAQRWVDQAIAQQKQTDLLESKQNG